MTKKILTTAAIILACTNLANAGAHGSHAKATTPSHSSGEFYDDMYVTLFGGVTMPQKFSGYAYRDFAEPKNGFTYGLGVGYQFDRNFRTDLTIQKIDMSAELNGAGSIKSKYENLLTSANAYFDIVTFNKLTPYLTAGAGIASIKPKLTVKGTEEFNGVEKFKSKSNFAWNVGAGFRHDFRDNITLDIGYKFINMGSVKYKFSSYETDNTGKKIKKSDTFNTKLNAHTFNVGVAYNF